MGIVARQSEIVYLNGITCILKLFFKFIAKTVFRIIYTSAKCYRISEYANSKYREFFFCAKIPVAKKVCVIYNMPFVPSAICPQKPKPVWFVIDIAEISLKQTKKQNKKKECEKETYRNSFS